jgi:hypothetical protein
MRDSAEVHLYDRNTKRYCIANNKNGFADAVWLTFDEAMKTYFGNNKFCKAMRTIFGKVVLIVC